MMFGYEKIAMFFSLAETRKILYYTKVGTWKPQYPPLAPLVPKNYDYSNILTNNFSQDVFILGIWPAD